jgi:hypothetical protein
MFAGDPQPVDVRHRGTWYPGELLGWRFEDDGRCLARVRCVIDGLRHSTWTELADLRLPAPAVPAPRPPVPAAPPAARWAAVGRHEAAAPPGLLRPRPGRHRALDDDTQPHALLADRDLRRRPPVPRTVPAPRSPGSPGTQDRLGSA